MYYDEIRLTGDHCERLTVIGVDHKEVQITILKFIARWKKLSVLDLSKKTKLTIERILYELPFLDKQIFTLENNSIRLSDRYYNKTEKEIKRMIGGL